MLIEYKIKAKTGIFTGDNKSSGNFRSLRREKVMYNVETKGITDIKTARENLLTLMYAVYSDIPTKLKQDYYGFYSQFTNKLFVAASTTKDKYRFISFLLESCSITGLTAENNVLVNNVLNYFHDQEIHSLIRQENAYLSILFRVLIDTLRKEKTPLKSTVNSLISLDTDNYQQQPDLFVLVPYIHGNSIRHNLRDLLMWDFCKQLGINAMNERLYTFLFSGGILDESQVYEDIEKREEFIRICPPLYLLGAAIGNMTIQGAMKVGGVRLRCKENGSGEHSFWDFISVIFNTHSDSAKKETRIEIKNSEERKHPVQMIYEYEVFIKTSEFNSYFIIPENNPLYVSLFWRMIKLWKQEPILGGGSARDLGLIEIDLQVPENADDLYNSYLKENADRIRKFFE